MRLVAYFCIQHMDSLTQIVLGAACGEAVLGKKIGNRALLFGAIGGTIPDLDVFVGNMLYSNQIDAMLFHRGFMHSFFFAILGAFVFGLITYQLYNTKKRLGSTNLKNWIVFYVWTLSTHMMLDAFTPYGTQLFAPFSSYRVAFNNISVVDPLYTVPFLVSLIILMFFSRDDERRRKWLKIGLSLSSAYMLFTIANKLYVDTIFKNTLKEKQVNYKRFSLQPSLLNTILWYGIAETDSTFQVGYYSHLDSKKEFSDWHVFQKKQDIDIAKNDQLASLAWFSNDYFSIERTVNNTYYYTDLRYPVIKREDSYEPVFFFELYRNRSNRFDMKPFDSEQNDFGYVLQTIWQRLKGK